MNRNEEVPAQSIEVMPAERWMDKPIKVVLSMQINKTHTSSQTFYLDREESEVLISALTFYLDTEDVSS